LPEKNQPCLGFIPPFPPDNFFLLRYAFKEKTDPAVTPKNVHPLASLHFVSFSLTPPDARRLAAGYKQQRLALLFINR
jgi:hypothetical protein